MKNFKIFGSLWSEVWKVGFQFMLILGLLGMNFDAAVVFVTKSSLFFKLAVTILCPRWIWEVAKYSLVNSSYFRAIWIFSICSKNQKMAEFLFLIHVVVQELKISHFLSLLHVIVFIFNSIIFIMRLPWKFWLKYIPFITTKTSNYFWNVGPTN